MTKTLKRLIISAFLLLGFLFPKIANASDFDITCNPNGCSNVPPIFNESGMYPGQTLSKTLKVTNGYSEARSFALEIQNFKDSTPSMGDALSITIFDNSNSVKVYGPVTVTKWKNDGFLHLGGIDAGAGREYKFKVDFADVGNDYQNQKLTFDMKMGFEDTGAGNPSNPTNVLGAHTVWGKRMPQVLGTEFTASPQPTPVPEIKGAQTCIQAPSLWWLYLAVEAILLLFYLHRTRKKKVKFPRWLIIPIFLAILSQIIHDRTGCSCADSGWCSKYLWLNLGLFAGALFIRLFAKRGQFRKT